MMPYLDGLQVAGRIRRDGDTTPILMLTARHEVTQRVAGFGRIFPWTWPMHRWSQPLPKAVWQVDS